MNTAQLTPRALDVIADSGETGEPIFRTPCSVGSGGARHKQSDWCEKCGCGNDKRGYAHLNACTTKGCAVKPLDDPLLQQLFGDAIEGALALGYQNSSPPPDGHWLTRFWDIGRAEAERNITVGGVA